jgi:hypothetical protein
MPSAHLTWGQMEKFGWEVLPHPPCSPDLTALYYQLFVLLKDYMRSQHNENDEAAQQTMHTLLKNIEMEFNENSIFRLVQRCQKYLGRSGNLVEQ